jgi:hypothetical protein
MDAADYQWILLSRISPGKLSAASQQVAARLGQLYRALLALAAVGAWLFARARQAGVDARLAQHRMAEKLAVSNRDLEAFAYIASHEFEQTDLKGTVRRAMTEAQIPPGNLLLFLG